jgi:Ca2+-binding EF-hand superfamily protein
MASVAKVEFEGGVSASKVGGVRRVSFKDGTVFRVKLLELSDAENTVTYDVIETSTPVPYLSAIHTIRLRRVSSIGHTLVEFTSDYSKDAGPDVIADAKFKKLEYLANLAKACESKAAKFFRQLNFAKLDKLTTDQVDAAWKLFDKDGNGTLDKKEISDVIEGLLKRISAEQSVIYSALASMFREADEKEVKVEAVTEDLFGVVGNPKRQQALVRELAGRLDVNKDGKVDYAEFKLLFSSWLEEKITEGIADTIF